MVFFMVFQRMKIVEMVVFSISMRIIPSNWEGIVVVDQTQIQTYWIYDVFCIFPLLREFPLLKYLEIMLLLSTRKKNLCFLQVISLHSQCKRTKDMVDSFLVIIFEHIFRELNSKADLLSKATLAGMEGVLH